jgi:hypothetical protein
VTQLLMTGVSAARILALDSPGHVIALFKRGVYVTFPHGLVVLVPPYAEPGPLHVHATALPSAAVGDPARAGGGALTVGSTRLSGDAHVWHPPPLPDPGPVVTTLRSVLRHRPDLDLSGGAGPAGQRRLSATLRSSGLAGAAAVLAGRGAGLTPTGDDILAGLLLVARAADAASEVALVALAREARTHDISRAFLEQAARGRSLAAVHDLFGACAAGDTGAAREARRRLYGVGASSGLDLAYGLLVGSANRDTAPWPGSNYDHPHR